MSNLSATMTQHPVGQGGMMSGLLVIPGGRFHWVYDCGSNQKDALTREIAEVAADGEIDCLLLSHLDSDHVNGIDQLLGNARVREVVLPYLNNIDRFLLAARDAANGALSGTSVAMLADIPGWFGARGVERVTFIEPSSDDDDGEVPGPDLPDGGMDGGYEGTIRAKWSRAARAEAREPGIAQALGPQVQHLQTQATMQFLPSYGPPLDWVLAPFAHRPSLKQMRAFEDALLAAFGRNELGDNFWLVVLGDATKRRKLRDCYDVIWSDHNLVSMALYAGPVQAAALSGPHVHRSPRWHPQQFRGEVGWLGTGDMHLDVQVRRKRFLSHYDALLPRVNVFGLPHHGSRLNYDHTLPHAMPNACQFVAAAGPNNYDHPSTSVKQSVRTAGRQFVRVNEKARATLQWRHQL
jgi:hypothetical protein